MAKFAVLFLAAVAFQAVSAGVLMNQRFEESALGDYKYGLQYRGYPTGKFDALFGELQTVSQDLTVYFQRALPNDRLVLKTLTWQCRELALYIDTIIEKLEAECYKYDGQVRMVLEQFCMELRDIQMQYKQIAAYTTDVYAATEMKKQFYMTAQRTIVQLEKLVRFVQTDFQQTYGDLYFMLKNVVADFLYAFRNIYSHVQYYGVYAEQSPMRLVSEIKEVTNYLTRDLQGLTHFDAQRMYAVREYIQHVETIFKKVQTVEGSYGNMEVSAAFQKIYSRLHRMHAYFMQMIDAEYMENVEVIRKQLIEELQFVCEAFEQFIQYAHGGNYKTFFYEILGDYLYAMQQFRMRMMHTEYLSNYHQGEYYGLKGFYTQGLYKNAGLWGKTGYQGLYRYGGYGYGLFGKYQGFAKYGQDLKQFDMQIQTLLRDLYKTFQTVSFDDMTMRQACMHMMREYTQQLEMTIERMHQYISYKAGSDAYMYQEVCQNLKQYLMALRQLCTMEFSHMEMTTQCYMYIQKIATEFEKLMFGMQQTEGAYYYLVKDVLYQYLTATYDLCMHLQSMTEIAYYGYLPYARQYYGGDYRMMENMNKYGRQYYGGDYKMMENMNKYGHQYYGGDYKMMENMNKYGRQYYGGDNKMMENMWTYGPYARQYRMMENFGQYGREYYGKYLCTKGQQMYESPKELVNQIQYVAADMSTVFQNGMSFNQKHAQVLAVQARHFAQMIKKIIDQLEAYEHVDAMIEQVIYKLREIQMKFQQLAAYNVFTNVQQLKTEFENCIQIACAQIEKLVMIAQEQAHGNFFYVIKDVLHCYLYGLQDICYQIKELAQYGEMYQYGQQGYGYGKYGREYGYDKYARGLFGLDKYGKGLGYEMMGYKTPMMYKNQMMYKNPMMYQNQMMGYQSRMGMDYETQMPYGKLWAAKYNQAAIRAY